MKSFDTSAATPLRGLIGRLAERLFGGWVRQVTPATLRMDAMAGLLGAALLIAVHALPDLLGLAAAPTHGAGAVLRHVFAQVSLAQPAALALHADRAGGGHRVGLGVAPVHGR